MRPRANTLCAGDCLSVMRRWPAACVDHAIIDAPYGVSRARGYAWRFSSHVTMHEAWDRFTRPEYLAFCRAWLTEVCRVVRPNGNLFLFGSYSNIYDLGYLVREQGLRVLNSIIWFKPNAQPSISCRMLTESSEQVIWAVNAPQDRARCWTFNYAAAKALNHGKQLRNVWPIPITPLRERRYGRHPNQKPLALIKRLVAIGTSEGDLILDCFAGTGTTGVAARQLGRRYVLIENAPRSLAIARARLAALSPPPC